MRRRIVTLAALTLSLSAIGIAPLTAQASSGPTETSGLIPITASLTPSVDVTFPTTSLDLGGLNPESGGSVPFSFNVAFNNTGYTVTFTSQNGLVGGAFRMVNSTINTDFLTYTIVGNNTGGDNLASYASGTTGAPITDAVPAFTFGVAGLSTVSTLPSGSYSDHVTVLVTAT